MNRIDYEALLVTNKNRTFPVPLSTSKGQNHQLSCVIINHPNVHRSIKISIIFLSFFLSKFPTQVHDKYNFDMKWQYEIRWTLVKVMKGHFSNKTFHNVRASVCRTSLFRASSYDLTTVQLFTNSLPNKPKIYFPYTYGFFFGRN